MSSTVNNSPLGKISTYISEYQPDLLFPIPRKLKRDEIHVPDVLPFKGMDIWNAYEISWLNSKGKPVVAWGEFIFLCESPNIIESKSFKLYLNSFNNTKFDSINDVAMTLQRDLSTACGASVKVKIVPLNECSDNGGWPLIPASSLKYSGIYLDNLDIECDEYIVDPKLLKTQDVLVTEILYSDLLKSNCLVTGQPDWGSVCIEYTGNKIVHEDLLKYIVSFRNHNEFHEQCVERIFMDVMQYCQPEKLSVYARYTRRGGLDINPFRSSFDAGEPVNVRLFRQ